MIVGEFGSQRPMAARNANYAAGTTFLLGLFAEHSFSRKALYRALIRQEVFSSLTRCRLCSILIDAGVHAVYDEILQSALEGLPAAGNHSPPSIGFCHVILERALAVIL